MSSRLRTRPLFLVWRVGIILGKANVIGEEVAQVCAPKARTMLNRLHHVSAAVIHQQALWSRRNVDNVNGVLSGRSGRTAFITQARYARTVRSFGIASESSRIS